MNLTNTINTLTGKIDISLLADWFRAGCRPESEWKIGTEHEQFLFHTNNLTRLGYNSKPGIREILEKLQKRGWEPVFEGKNIIGLANCTASISIEPGGQFELSGGKQDTVHETFAEAVHHTKTLKELGNEMGFRPLSIGFDPFSTREEIDWMPKERYRFMRNWMPGKGNLGLDMMTRTSTIHLNLDFSSEADMIKKMQVGQAFQPVIIALFANSPFIEGKLNGYLSYRSHVWDDTDPDRCGCLKFVFDKDFGFEKYCEYLLDVPLYFIIRDGQYHPSGGLTFREFLEGKHLFKATKDDWELHVTTVFPDIRLKRVVELRGADAGPPEMVAALAAFWVGLFYNQQSLGAAHNLIDEFGIETIMDFRFQAPKKALHAKSNGISLLSVAEKLLSISKSGLAERAGKLNIEPELKYLEPLVEIVATGQTNAEHLIGLYKNSWNGDLKNLFLQQ